MINARIAAMSGYFVWGAAWKEVFCNGFYPDGGKIRIAECRVKLCHGGQEHGKGSLRFGVTSFVFLGVAGVHRFGVYAQQLDGRAPTPGNFHERAH